MKPTAMLITSVGRMQKGLHTMSDDTTKQCSKCSQDFPATREYFYAEKRNRSGLTAACILCGREYSKQYSEGHRDEAKTRASKWYYGNKERALESSKDWQSRNPEKKRQISTDYDRRHPEEKRNRVRQRRALKANAKGSHTFEDVKALYEAQSGKCFHCGVELTGKFDEDHWMPLTRGGSDYIENIRLMCGYCNRSKGNKLPHEWCPERYSE